MCSTHAITSEDVELLLREAQRYLAVVDAFRAEGWEPVWAQELPPALAQAHAIALLADEPLRRR